MACDLTTGFALDCKDGIGGIKEIFLAAHTEVQTNVTIVANVVTTLGTMTLYRYELPKNTGSFVQTPSIDPNAGTTFWTQVVTAILFKLSTTKNKEIALLAKQRLVVFVRDQNDNIWIVGRQDSAYLSDATFATGTGKGDLNGVTLGFTAEEKLPAEALSPYTTNPFDNFADVTVSPAYPTPET